MTQPLRNKGLIAYGTEKDRAKLAALAQIKGQSASEVMIDLIRSDYEKICGNTDPNCIISQQ